MGHGEQVDEADRGRHTGFSRCEGLAGSPGSLSLSFTESEKKSVWRVAVENHLFKKPHVRSDFQRLLAQQRGRNNRATEAPSDSQPL